MQNGGTTAFGMTVSVRGWGVVLLVALLWAVGTPSSHAAASSADSTIPEPLAAGVVALVNGDPIMAAEVAAFVAARVPQVSGHGVVSDERIRFHRDQVIRELVVRQLMLQEAKHEQVEVTQAELDGQVAALQGRFTDESGYLKALASQGLDDATVRAGLRDHLMGEKLAARVMGAVGTPSTEQLHAYYDANLEKFKVPTQAELSYLMLDVDPSGSRDEWTAARERMTELKGQLAEGDSLASLLTDDDEGLHLISLGRVHKGQTGVEEIDAVAFEIEPGTVSDPVWTLYGYALVRVAERTGGRQLAFDELNRDLFAQEWLAARRKEARNEWVAGLVRKAELKFAE